ncbi:MAG: BRO family protein [bacterium]
MSKNLSTFEKIARIDDHNEFWLARELMPLLGYKRWEDFHKLIQKTKIVDFEEQNDHIRYAPKLIKAGKGATRETTDYQLSRFACYKIAMLGNTNECIQARTYFAIQTRKQEKFEELTEDLKRLKIRQDVTDHNKKLFETAKNSGVENFADFNDAGYLGLYGMRNKEIVKKKELGKDNLLDRAGATELAANLFRITQTDEKLNNENIYQFR